MRLRWFLALSSVLLVVIGLTVVLHERLDAGTGAGDQVVSGGGREDGGGTDDGEDGGGLAGGGDTSSGDIEVSGRVTAVHLERAVLDPTTMGTPLTITSERGLGNGGELTGVSVSGRDSSIVWDGGRPFVLSSGPGLDLEPATVDLVEGHLRYSLGGTACTVLAGDYQLDTPVAVGGTGIATPRDAVAFTAGPRSRFEAHGDAALVLAGDAAYTFTGPGIVHLDGDLEVMRTEGGQLASSLDLRSGPFELTFSPTEGGGWTVSGRVQSRLVGDLTLGDPK